MSTYAGGEAKFRVSNPNGPWQSFNFSHDYGFKTYVDVTSQGLPGDYNDDGQVDAADFAVWRDNFGAPDESALHGNGDGMNGVDDGDYTHWAAHFGASAAGTAAGGNDVSAATAVPEPVATGLVLCGAIVAAGLLRPKPPTCDNRRSAARTRP